MKKLSEINSRCQIILNSFHTIYSSQTFSHKLLNYKTSFLFQLAIKMYSMKYSDILISLMNKDVEIYAANSNIASPNRIMLAQQFSTITEWIFECGFVLYAGSGMFYLLYPLHSYFWLDKTVPIMPLYMPFIDENTTSGFVELTVIHLEFIVTTVIGSAGVDFIFIMLIFNIIFFARIFKSVLLQFRLHY